MRPQLIVEVFLYPVGGRDGPVFSVRGAHYGCVCKLTRNSPEGRDCRMLLDGEPILLGQPRRLGFVFLSSDSADVFRAARKFYLWEGKIIGEAVVVRNTN